MHQWVLKLFLLPENSATSHYSHHTIHTLCWNLASDFRWKTTKIQSETSQLYNTDEQCADLEKCVQGQLLA